jgi:hypothetical protein
MQTEHKGGTGLSLLALGLDLVPLFLVPFSFLLGGSGPLLLFALLAPAGGLITGIAALCRGKDQMSRAARTLAIIAIVLPIAAVLLLVGFLVIIFIGVSTGVMSLM